MGDDGFSYKSRIVDSTLSRKLRGKGAILIEGPKWCGNTTPAEQYSNSILSVDDPVTIDANIAMSEIDPVQSLCRLAYMADRGVDSEVCSARNATQGSSRHHGGAETGRSLRVSNWLQAPPAERKAKEPAGTVRR